MNAKEICHQLGGTWHGGYGTAPCPVCQPQSRRDQNALTLSDKEERLLLHCKRSGCQFVEILDAIGLRDGEALGTTPALVAPSQTSQDEQAKRRASQARSCWDESLPLEGTIGENYIRARAITAGFSRFLRFHPECWHKSARRHPAIVAAITRLSGRCSPAIHRTYLRRDGWGKADLDPPKAMLGSAAGGCVVVRAGEGPVVAAEGIETALSLESGIYDGPGSIVAALSTSGLRNLILPCEPSTLIVAPDGDTAGRKAAFALAEDAQALGWRVECLDPGDGHDWNSVLQSMNTPKRAA